MLLEEIIISESSSTSIELDSEFKWKLSHIFHIENQRFAFTLTIRGYL